MISMRSDSRIRWKPGVRAFDRWMVQPFIVGSVTFSSHRIERAMASTSRFCRTVMKRARRGLYAGKHIGFGNKISEDGGNKSRRSWKPNVQNKRLYSEVLDEMVRFRVTTSALRWIDKAGGLDQYLLNTPEKKINSDRGLEVKRRILAKLSGIEP